jgi:hypothetical protein
VLSAIDVSYDRHCCWGDIVQMVLPPGVRRPRRTIAGSQSVAQCVPPCHPDEVTKDLTNSVARQKAAGRGFSRSLYARETEGFSQIFRRDCKSPPPRTDRLPATAPVPLQASSNGFKACPRRWTKKPCLYPVRMDAVFAPGGICSFLFFAGYCALVSGLRVHVHAILKFYDFPRALFLSVAANRACRRHDWHSFLVKQNKPRD